METVIFLLNDVIIYRLLGFMDNWNLVKCRWFGRARLILFWGGGSVDGSSSNSNSSNGRPSVLVHTIHLFIFFISVDCRVWFNWWREFIKAFQIGVAYQPIWRTNQLSHPTRSYWNSMLNITLKMTRDFRFGRRLDFFLFACMMWRFMPGLFLPLIQYRPFLSLVVFFHHMQMQCDVAVTFCCIDKKRVYIRV